MSKNKRGKNIHQTPNWRGVCPICGRTGVKLLWEKTKDEQQLKVCKICGNK